MSTAGLPALLEEPVWYEPLLRPSWLLPSIRDGAPRILVRPGEGGDHGPRLGLPLFLGDAVRYSSDARVDVATGDWAVTAGSAAVVTTGLGMQTHIDVAGPDGELIEEVRLPGADDPALGAALAALPTRIMAALLSKGVRAVWSTVFRAPAPDRAVATVHSYGALARLRAFAAESPDGEAGERAVDPSAALTQLARSASASSSPLDVAAFIAGLAVARQAGWVAWGEHRLQANALAQAAKDPLDPVFRLSILSLILFGDTGEASARAHRMGDDPGEDLRAWLARLRTIG